MPDYSKLTVVKLRDELQKRGLPKTGLKPVLVNRLIESDAQSQDVGSTEETQAAEPTGLKSKKAAVDQPPTQVEANVPGDAVAEEKVNGLDNQVPQHSEYEPGATTDSFSETVVSSDTEPAQAFEAKETAPPAPEETVQEQPSTHEAGTAHHVPEETVQEHPSTHVPGPSPHVPDKTVRDQDSTHVVDTSPLAPGGTVQEQTSSGVVETISHAPEEATQEKNPSERVDPQLSSEIANGSSTNEASGGVAPCRSVGVSEKLAEEEFMKPSAGKNSSLANDVQLAESTKASANQSSVERSSLANASQLSESTQVSVTASELLEDSRKRKRRSKSPAPLTQEIAQKRAKMEGLRSDVKLPEDARKELLDEEAGKSEDAIMVDANSMSMQPPKVVHTTSDTPMDVTRKSTTEFLAPSDSVDESESTPRDPHRSENSKAPQPDIDETSPKHSPSDARFKSLFTGPSKRDPSPMRQALHSDEEERVVSPALHPATSALYIRDFMRPLQPGNLQDHLNALAKPSGASAHEESITEFFLDNIRTHCLVRFVNTSAASRVRSSLHNRVWPDERTRRPLWVDFVPEEKLQKWIEVERGTYIGRGQVAKRWEVVYEDERDGIKAYLQEAGSNSQPMRGEGGQGVQGAPSGPRTRELEPRPSLSGGSSKPDSGRGFQALDDLFRSTVTKPKLYYLPVNKATVDRRLDRLDAGRGGGRGNEMRRYSFEDGIIVDRGPEYGSRGRGGHGGRGGGYGGGFHSRGGGYRGDSWRERR